MAFNYPVVSDVEFNLNSGSYLNKTDYNLFYSSSLSDFWFGISKNDAIEFSIYDLNENLIHWKPITEISSPKITNLTYYDNKNNSVSYSYEENVLNYPLYKSKNILLNPISDISSSNLSTGSFYLSYQFTRYLAGNPSNTLIIKEISPNKTELKLIPTENTTEYESFCLGKILLKNVSPLYINLTKNCPYTDLYNKSKITNQSQINLVKTLFFISDDGKFVEFLKSLYEDYIKYSIPSEEKNTFTRIQGIRTYFSNFLVSNTEKSYYFNDINDKFKEAVSSRLDILFVNYKASQYITAKQYLFDFFINDYFGPIHKLLESKYNEKFTTPLKNSLNFGVNGEYIPILNTSYVDERNSPNDPLTLLVKIQTPLNDGLSVKSSVWVSNIGMVPILFRCIIKDNIPIKTLKISPADFTVIPENISLLNTSNYFNKNSLTNVNVNDDDNIVISKKLNELNIDYTSLNNFVVFSSAELRHTIFKNKILSLSTISGSISSINTAYSASSYPYYSTELETYQTQKTEIIESFDGFESYLYKTGHYDYNPTLGTYKSSSFVEYMDEETKRYDKYNGDSLVNNTPEYIILDSENDDYLIFLSMVGHFFDNLYVYIKSLPTEKYSDDNDTFSRSILQQLLQLVGWKLDASLESLNISDNYLDINSGGNNKMSADERTRQVWNRILNVLPLIYKAKGTEECINLVLSCYGIPSTLLSVREFGGVDYIDTDKTSFVVDEKIYMLNFKGTKDFINLPCSASIKTLEFKVSLDTNKTYTVLEKIPLAIKSDLSGNVDWSLGVFKDPKKYMGKVYFDIENSSIVSDTLPIFNGEIFNVMLRRNNPDALFEYTSTIDAVPTTYDLWAQRRDDSREIYNSHKTNIFTQSINEIFSRVNNIYFGNYQNTSSFSGLLDKILIWDSPITDETFIDHCNNINSYSYTGSQIPYETLYFRMNYDYPQDFSSSNPFTIVNSNEYYSSSVKAYAYNFGLVSYSASLDNCVYVSHSYFPYQFEEISYNQTFIVTSYGPNRFKNEKVHKTEFELSARLDSDDRSTYSKEFISPDSIQIGLFADPNNYKNKDISRYLGNAGITDLLADPMEMFSDKYSSLKTTRDQYEKSGHKKTLYNEMFILYKLYFDKSIFEVVKQLIPSRNNILTGILVEPTVLERPKYQYKTINATGCESDISSSVSSSIHDTSRPPIISTNDTIFVKPTTNNSEIIYANFGVTSGSNKTSDTTISLPDIKTPTVNYPTDIHNGVIKDIENPEELGIHCDESGKILEANFDGVRYLIKHWKKDYTYMVSGEYNKPQTMSSQSVFLYDTQIWSDLLYQQQVYTSSTNIFVDNDTINSQYPNVIDFSPPGSITIGGYNFYHSIGTFKSHPNSKTNNLYATSNYYNSHLINYNIFDINPNEYFETLTGYSRNHLSHTNIIFSKYSYPKIINFDRINGLVTFDRYVKSMQTLETTIGEDGLENNTLPIQSVNVSEINVINSDNVLIK